LGLSSLLLAIAYTGGPFPLAYLGLGDLFVLGFFGLGATAGTFWLLTLEQRPGVWIAGFAVGALATGILVVNNLRDRLTDAQVGKRTLAVRFGERAGRIEYSLLLASAYGAVALGVQQQWLPTGALWVFASLPQALLASRAIWRFQGAALNPLLGSTARLEALFGMLLIIGVA
jgi:1,4-dihydroxy-2-naphthoate octaprenyltransferase